MRGIKTEKQISEKAPAYDKHVLIHIIYCKMLSSKLEHMEKKNQNNRSYLPLVLMHTVTLTSLKFLSYYVYFLE